MLATDFALKCKEIAENVPTIYKLGGWGQYNSKRGVFEFDCNCFIKSVLDGFKADKSKPFGGAKYGKPCPDISIKDMLQKECVDVSQDMSNILPGEYLAYLNYGHCGIYLGDGLVAECTYRWKNGVQITRIDQPERKTLWAFHGKLWKYMDYTYRPDVVWGVQTGAYKSIANAKKYIKEGQHIFKVDPLYKTAYVFDSKAQAEAALPTIKASVKDAFVTNYKGESLVI